MKQTYIIYTHYGNTSYLTNSLQCATKSNPCAKRILIGDEFNKKLALEAGWEHYCFEDITSKLRDKFNSVFKIVQGRNHNHMKNGKNWLKYVFERWFIVEEYCRRENISEFWHFDSDVMILKNLDDYAEKLKSNGVNYTKQCNNTCINGYISLDVLRPFLEYTIKLFEDESFLNNQQKEFDEIHQNYAFTEMRAFDIFSKQSNFKGVHLECYFKDLWFDDCIAQPNGFKTIYLPFKRVKHVYVDTGGFYGIRQDKKVYFVTINCSWVPDSIFSWILNNLQTDNNGSFGKSFTLYISCFKDVLYNIPQIFKSKIVHSWNHLVNEKNGKSWI